MITCVVLYWLEMHRIYPYAYKEREYVEMYSGSGWFIFDINSKKIEQIQNRILKQDWQEKE